MFSLAAPAVGLASDHAAGDGSLGVSAATGSVVVKGHGVIYGHYDQGTLTVVDYKADDGTSVPSVSNVRGKATRGGIVYSGTDVRFLLPSGRYTIELVATNVNASAVGKGMVTVTGAGTPDDGTVTVNGGKPVALSRISLSQAFGNANANASAAAGKGN